MRAVVVREVGAPAVLRVESIPRPALQPEEVLIRVEACGVCFHDVVVRQGVLRRRVRMPLVPGHEVSGVVEAVGPQVEDLRPGDRVATTQHYHVCGRCRYCRSGRETACPELEMLGDAGLNGGYAEFVRVEADNAVRVPEGVPLDRAAIAACAIGTELKAVRDVARVKPGDRVLVSGAGGGVGIHGVQLARLAGGFVIAVTTSSWKAERIRAAGAHEVLVVERGGDFSPAVRELTRGAGVDVVIDNVGSVLFQPTRRSLAPGARWVLVGQLTGDFVQLSPAQIFLQEISILSARGASRAQLQDVLELMRLGQLEAVIAEELPLEEAPKAHALMERGGSLGRLLLRRSR